jgi:hypothetical protein
MADEPDAFTLIDTEVDTVERADGAEVLFDAVQLDDTLACHFRHGAHLMGAGSTVRSAGMLTSCWL